MAKSITFARFDAGIDTRKSATTSDANRMRDLLNCDVTNGLTIRKRPGLRRVKDLPADSAGLFSNGAQLTVVTPESVGSTLPIDRVHYHTMAAGYLYVSLEIGGIIRHYWYSDNSELAKLYELEVMAQPVRAYSGVTDLYHAQTLGNALTDVLASTQVSVMSDDWRDEAQRLLEQFEVNYTGYVSAVDEGNVPGAQAHHVALSNTIAAVIAHVMLISDRLTAELGTTDRRGSAALGEIDAYKIIDDNCPHTPQVVSLAGKIFSPSPDGATVRFSATNNPGDWSTADDAGFLPVSHHGGGRVTALAVYRGMLAVFTDVHVQIWRVDPDPAQHSLIDIAHGIGSEHARSITSVSGDVLFMAYAGVRSLSQQSSTGNLSDVDIGSPVDELALAMLKRQPGYEVIGHYSQSLGKYLLFIGSEVLVYSFSRTAKLAAWSRWELPGVVTAAAELLGVTYLRLNDALFALDDTVFKDDEAVFPVRADMAYMALKAPGAMKRVLGLDVAIEGTCELSIGCNERDESEVYRIGTLTGDTRAGGTVPVELTATAFAPRFHAEHDGVLQVDLLTFYYDAIGVR